MGKCAQCGNNYDESFEVTKGGRTLTFDSFECAIATLAPVCPHCGVRLVGHGVQHGDTIYCASTAPSLRREGPRRPGLDKASPQSPRSPPCGGAGSA